MEPERYVVLDITFCRGGPSDANPKCRAPVYRFKTEVEARSFIQQDHPKHPGLNQWVIIDYGDSQTQNATGRIIGFS